VSQIPREARDGLMRAWLEILRDRHPGASWIVEETPQEGDSSTNAQNKRAELAAA
jgi:hypothetical protein